MGCSGSKAGVAAVKETVESDKFQATVDKARVAIVGPDPTETELAQQELRDRMKANDAQRRNLEKTRTPDPAAATVAFTETESNTINKKSKKDKKKSKKKKDRDSSSSSSSSATSSSTSSDDEDASGSRRHRRRKKGKASQQANQEVDDAREECGGADAPLVASPSTTKRGYVNDQQKDDLRNQYAATLGGGGHQSPRAAAATGGGRGGHEDGVAHHHHNSEDAALDHIDDCCDDEALVLLKQIVVRTRHERDAAVVELKRVAAERDASREEYAYLRATADASDSFDNILRIPPDWAVSEHQRMEELRQRNLALEGELAVIRHQLRSRKFKAADRPALVQVLSTSGSAAGGGSPGLLSSPSSAWGGGYAAAPAFGDEQLLNAPVPLSPTELASSVRSLQARYLQTEQEVRRIDSEHRAAVYNAQQEASQLSRHSSNLQQSLTQLERQQKDYAESTSKLSLSIRALEDQLRKKQAELAAATEAAAREAAAAEQHRAAAQVHQQAAASAEASAAAAVAAAAAAKEEEAAAIAQKKERDADAVAQAAIKANQKQSSDAAQFLRQVSRLLVSAAHCPDETRLQLLQFVCEHAGLPVEGRGPRLVKDATDFDMNGVLYGDSVAYLASLIIARPECRIESLTLSETSMTDLGCAQIALTLAVLPFETSLRQMNLSNNEISSRGVLQLLTALQSSVLRGGSGKPAMITQHLVVDLDNNPVFQTVEDVQMVAAQVESMKTTIPLVEVLLPRVPKLEQLSGSTAKELRSSSVFKAHPLGA